MAKQVILTGLRANNELHIGNYFGALLPMIDMAKKHAGEYQINLFVPDLHSFTTPIDHSQLQDQISNNLRVFAAAGLPLDNPDVHVYRQSYIPAHSELTWILQCFTGIGHMSRMTQFKEKSSNENEDNTSVGLFAYPILMAADILLYNASYVPVGDDQTQHLEFTRDIAQRMNSKFGDDLFTVPYEVQKQHELFGNDQGLRIKNLVDPSKKMSKSDETRKGVIFLNDDPSTAAAKIRSAATDSYGEIKYDRQERPGIANLIEIMALLKDEPLDAVINRYSGQDKYGPFKEDVAHALEQFLIKFQTSYSQVDQAQLESKLQASEELMRQQSAKTLLKVQRAVGLRR